MGAHAGMNVDDVLLRGVRVVFVLLGASLVAFAAVTLYLGLFGTWDRSRQARTMADMRSIAFAFEEIRQRDGRYPDARDIRTVLAATDARLPAADAWGNDYLVVSLASGFGLRSLGRDGRYDGGRDGPTTSYDDDIVLRNGEFVRYPEGMCR